MLPGAVAQDGASQDNNPPAAEAQVAETRAAVGRALDYLAVEVPKRPVENHCYSCHNNGDAARVLLVARRLGLEVGQSSLASTLAWLADPDKWPETTGDAPFKDQALAAIQFGAALVEAAKMGVSNDRESLSAAARQIAPFQDEDGSWTIDGTGLGGSPVAYSRALSTALARRVLVAAGEGRPENPFAERIAATDRWLRSA